ncbi:FGFR1 oncogene partner 2 homolog isoform X2 [Lepeophtheirus salmonis]|uniref:Uncharacterized protein n=1 Tax=Lepeophtheirus salmonis TaxID=72036 RepID=A0A0K2TX46_LEPSM|nr:FGFR1 oncogene partner 2 homolog isoform X2 [Lepeophtheirus salmonis]
MTSMREILEDARKLSRRLRSHDVAFDKLIGSAEDNLKRIQALKQYQEAQDELNAVGSSKLRAQIVLDMQKENRHIRELQQENVELRAALEDHQKATELIMSKYRQHLSHLVNSSKVDKNLVNYSHSGVLQDRDDKICEMASVMNYAIVIDEENQNRENEFVSKLVIENQGLRELLEISRCNGSLKDPLARPKMISRLSQTDVLILSENGDTPEEEDKTSENSDHDGDSDEEQNQLCSSTDSTTSSSSITSILVSPIASNSMMLNSDESDDEHVVYNTIKKQHKRPSVVNVLSLNSNPSVDIHKIPNGEGGSDGNASSSPDVEEEISDDTIISDNNSSNKFLETRVLLPTAASDGAVCQN